MMLIETILRAGESANEPSKGLKQEAAFTPTTYWLQIVSRVGEQAQGVYGSLLRRQASVVSNKLWKTVYLLKTDD
jgi:hypothetical protein